MHTFLPPVFVASCSELAELLQRFAGLHQALHGASKLSGARAMQVIAACLAIGGCAELSARLPLQRGMMFRLTSALALVFGVGPAVMRHCASPASGASVELQHFLVECNDQLSAVIGVLMRAAREPEAMEAFVRTAGRPQAVLPWLLAISQALLAVPTDVRGDAPILQGGKRISRKGRGCTCPWPMLVNLHPSVPPSLLLSQPACSPKRHICLHSARRRVRPTVYQLCWCGICAAV